VPEPHPNPIVRGEKVWLRPLEREDLAPSLRGINDREINALAGFWGPIGDAMSERWFEEEVLKKQGESMFAFAICKLGSSELIGQCGFNHFRPGLKGEVGIFMLGDQVGRGLGTDAMNALVDFGFGQLGLERIELLVDADNARAIRSYEKSGFSHEGRLRSIARSRGKMVDGLMMSILRPEWEALDRPRSWDLPVPRPKRTRPPAKGARTTLRR
jgi:RimJ/RimL family protein N-acetyltransferase